jgi:hypothetical protein
MVVLWFLEQKSNCTVLHLKSFGTKHTHSCLAGLKGGSLFLDLKVLFCFVLSTDRRLMQMDTLSCLILGGHFFHFFGAQANFPTAKNYSVLVHKSSYIMMSVTIQTMMAGHCRQMRPVRLLMPIRTRPDN